ncbi:divalent-cation tolerance protein CutA [Comamonas humi]
MNTASRRPSLHPLAEIAWLTTTVDAEAQARELARAGVEARLAACAQVEAIVSHYWWEGALQESAEWRITWKTTPRQLDALQAQLAPLHPYELPQWTHGLCGAAPAYALWVAQQVAPRLQV